MSVTTPKFLSRQHLAKWLQESQDGQAACKLARPYSFESLQDLERWLQTTASGNDVLSRFEHTRRKVLVVMHADNWVEVYAAKDVDVHMSCKPSASTAEAGVLAERYLEATLPRGYADLYCPGNRRNADKCRRVTAQSLLANYYDREAFQALSTIEK